MLEGWICWKPVAALVRPASVRRPIRTLPLDRLVAATGFSATEIYFMCWLQPGASMPRDLSVSLPLGYGLPAIHVAGSGNV